MTPQEKDLITSLMDRLTKAGGEPKDREAEALIRQSVAEQPDAPYQLVQTVLIQDMALNQAQSRIADLEKKLAEATPRTQQPTSFLGGLAGRFGVPPQQPGPWRQQAPPSSGNSQASYGQGQGQGGYARPDYPQPAFPGGVQGGRAFSGLPQRPPPGSRAERSCSRASGRCSATMPMVSSAASSSSRP
jgi:hypothetical protein